MITKPYSHWLICFSLILLREQQAYVGKRLFSDSSKSHSVLMSRDFDISIYTENLVFSSKTSSYSSTECLARSHAVAVWRRILLAARQWKGTNWAANNADNFLRFMRSGNEAKTKEKRKTSSGWAEEKRKWMRKGRNGKPDTLNRWLESVLCPFSFRVVSALALLSSRFETLTQCRDSGASPKIGRGIALAEKAWNPHPSFVVCLSAI